jgi:hypothetical protein
MSARVESERGESEVTGDKFCEEEGHIDYEEDNDPCRAREAHRRRCGRGRGQADGRLLPLWGLISRAV